MISEITQCCGNFYLNFKNNKFENLKYRELGNLKFRELGSFGTWELRNLMFRELGNLGTHSRVSPSSGFGSRSRRFERNRNVSSPSTCETQYCGEPPWPRGSVLGLRPSGLEFRILCLEDSVISFISPSSGGSPGPI